MSTIIARRRTADNKTVYVYNDGDLTSAFGLYFRGASVRKDVALSLLIADEACLFDAGELGVLIRAANDLAKKGLVLPGELRALAASRLSLASPLAHGTFSVYIRLSRELSPSKRESIASLFSMSR